MDTDNSVVIAREGGGDGGRRGYKRDKNIAKNNKDLNTHTQRKRKEKKNMEASTPEI